ncbi:MAG TPA: DUF58 domain-containing protein, partial [Chryseosolibacter sp.]|nr:DUF58 domain-containing protein [Chryseosolibacter sp.]
MNFIKNFFVSTRFFYVMGGLALAMMLSHAFPFLLPVVKTGLVFFVILCLIDVVLLFNKRVVLSAERETAPVFS